jgi:hypothetical protein
MGANASIENDRESQIDVSELKITLDTSSKQSLSDSEYGFRGSKVDRLDSAPATINYHPNFQEKDTEPIEIPNSLPVEAIGIEHDAFVRYVQDSLFKIDSMILIV